MKHYLEKFPSYAGLARALGKRPNVVVQWGVRGLIPPGELIKMEDLAKEWGIKGIVAREMQKERERILDARRAERGETIDRQLSA